MPLNPALQRWVRPIRSVLQGHRILAYAFISTVAVLLAIANALRSRSNFYSVSVYLSKSSRSVVVLANFGVVLAVAFGRILQQVFFGPLRASEVERLYDRIWFFVTESLLACTIFRDEFDTPFVVMFALLLFTKCFHWLLSDRIEWMDQIPYPGPSTLFHIRMGLLFHTLLFVDAAMLGYALESTINHGVGAVVLFASEYAILLANLLNSALKYGISVTDLRRARHRGGEAAPPWEDKSMYIFYVELATDFLKLITYLTFFLVVLAFYGLPLNIIRDVYITMRSFLGRIRDIMRYRMATRNMDERYPNATDEELTDRVCIICREEMFASLPGAPLNAAAGAAVDGTPLPTQPPQTNDGPNTTPKKLPCGHIFHFHCLRSWLERQQSCPTCRRSVLENNTPAPGPNGNPRNLPRQANFGMQPPNFFRLLARQDLGPQQNFGGIPAAHGFPPPAGAPPLVAPQFFPPGLPDQRGGAPVLLPVAGQPGWAGAPPPAYLPLQAAQAPPTFQGFYGPDGVWRPWNGRHGLQPPPAMPEQRLPAPSPAPTGVSRSSTSQGSTATNSSPSSGGETRVLTSDEAASNPREAVARAALRRLGSGIADNAEVHPQPSTSAVPSPTATVSPPSSTRHPSSTTESAGAIDVNDFPTMIPLLQTAASPRPLLSSRAAPSFPWQSLSPTNPTSYSPGALPAVLSDVQLARLDNLTREAIDERLQILQNISSSADRMIEDLMRVRSVLPGRENGTSTEAGSSTGEPSGSGTRRTGDDVSTA